MNNEKEICPVPNSTGLFTSTQVMTGDLDEIIVEKKLSKPPIIERTQYRDKNRKRNDFYVTISSVELEGKASKIEVSAAVYDKHGVQNKAAICDGQGENYIPEFSSSVYHSSNPTFEEGFCIRVSEEDLNGLHILFTIKSVSSKENKNKVLSHALFRLLGESGTTVSDNIHPIKQFRMVKGKFAKDLAYTKQENIVPLQVNLKIKTVLASNQLTSVGKKKNDFFIIFIFFIF